ncbi:MAG: hypothetical protein GAK45_02164 [Pseudomonas citronellolis]|nr:MAG: hypothetical protein GAK45_02164 [Pseudomonas citronellolis]
MRTCLYCQHCSDDNCIDCPQCGMPLPVGAALAQQRRLGRFRWFCALLALFCLIMAFWLPR